MQRLVMSDSELDDAAAELYSVDPKDFVAARTAAAASAKESGNRKLAAAIGKLRKPTTVGWMVNLLVRDEPDDIADLFDLGDRLRDAQRRSSADELRELSAARAQSIRALTRRAVEIALEHGHSSSENTAREVGQTLGAALADPEIGERVRAGRVVTAESYSGFGPAVLSLAPEPKESEESEPAEPKPEAHLKPDQEPEDPRDHAAIAEAHKVLTEAREDEASARDAVDAADSAVNAASTNLTEIKERLVRLRAELHDAEAEETEARKAEKSTDREARRLRRVLTGAEARTAELSSALEDLGG